MINSEMFIEESTVSRVDQGGVNTAGRDDQQYVCTFTELIQRAGNCSIIPDEPTRGTPVYTKGVQPGSDGRCEPGAGEGLCEYVPEWDGWKFTRGDLSKTTISHDRLDWFKATPGQAAARALVVTNTAPGDMMAQVVTSIDLVGAHSAGDEGNMLLRGHFRDWSATPHGLTSTRIDTKAVSDQAPSSFTPMLLGNRQLHWATAGPSRLMVFPELETIRISVERAGYNPKPDFVNGGATWKLAKPLPRLLRSRRQPNGMLRTDFCLSLDANEYRSTYGPERQFLQVSETPDKRTLVTNFVRQGQDKGVPKWFVNGYATVDAAVTDGHTEGELVPCSVIKAVRYPDTAAKEYELEFVTTPSGNRGQAVVEGEFVLEPMTEVDIPSGAVYRIPAAGMYSLQALKLVVDQRLGAGGESNGIMMFAGGSKDSRPGDVAYFAGGVGRLPEVRMDVYPYFWEKGIELRDAKYPINVHNPSLETPRRPLAVLGALNATYRDHIQFSYNQPTEGLSEVVLDPPPGRDHYLVTVRVGKGAPSPKACTRPGIERYYQLDTDSEWICSASKEFKNHSCQGC